MKSKIIMLILFILGFYSVYGETVIKIVKPESERDIRQLYYVKVLELALEKSSAKYGSYKIERVKAGIQGRTAILLEEGSSEIDLMWTMTNKERESKMLPVRIPLLKGLMGYRIFIINTKDKEKFKSIKDLKELKKMKAVQGLDWPDTDILVANGFNVDKATDYEGMFKMVDYGRVDYFPRGLNEPFDEIDKRKELNITIDNNIMLYYFAPFYFFVNVKRADLRNRIQYGLELAIDDGSFDKLFYSDKSNMDMLKRIDFKKYKIYKLNNPFLTKETKKIEKNMRYIFNIEK